MASWVGAQGPRKQAALGTRLQAASEDSRRHNRLLVRPGAGLWVGVGEGKPGKEEAREAGQEQACSPLTTPLGQSVSG